MFKWWFGLLVVDFFALTWLGAFSADALGGYVPALSLLASTYWLAYILVILPLLGVIEKPEAQPATIEEDFAAKFASSGSGAQPSAQPAE